MKTFTAEDWAGMMEVMPIEEDDGFVQGELI